MAIIEFIYKTILFFLNSNREFFKILEEFHDKLPPQHKRAKEKINSGSGFTTIDTTNMKMNLKAEDIDLFIKKLENFNYTKIYFGRKKIVNYSKNIQRILSSSGWDKFGIAIIQNILEDDIFKKSKPYILGSWIGKFIGY